MRLILLLFALALFSCGSVSPESPEENEHSTELAYNYRLLQFYYYYPDSIKPFSAYSGLPEVDLMYESINDTLRGSRYTRYYKPDTAQEVIDNTQNSYRYHSFGFERRFNEEGDTLIVSAVYPNSPANSAGLKKYDKLLFANNLELTGDYASLYISKDSLFDSITVFEVLRDNDIVSLERMEKEEVRQPTVYLDSLYGVPVIRVTEFVQRTNDPEGTYQEFKNYLREIRDAESAIIDMRNNLGGSIYHCTAMAAELSEPNKELIYDVQHYPKNNKPYIEIKRYFARDFEHRVGDGVGIKWVIMINGWSASCAERFVAAVKAARPETILVGQTTYGKGIGQSYMETYLKGVAFITSLQTFSPSNRETFHRVGIPPDIETEGSYGETTEVALDAAFSFRGGVPAKRSPLAAKDLPPERLVKKEYGGGMHYFINGNN
jgi:C-terminal processing protease CtpA/Prc